MRAHGSRKRFNLPELLALLVILSLAVSLRIHHLGADPPSELSVSTDVYTDPPQYTLSARQLVQTGDSNPFGDYRFPFFENSSVAWLSVVVFELFGIGMVQMQLVGVLFSLVALILFYLFVRRVAGAAAGLVFFLLATFDYNLIFYGRLPFLEHAMTSYAFLALVLVVYGRSAIVWLAGGVALGVAVFFGKLTGLAFLPAFAAMLLFSQVFQRDIDWRKPVALVGGFAVIAIVWYLVVYHAEQKQAAAYLAEHSISLYGEPEGLKSLDDFFFKMVSFGRTSLLFPRMPLAALLAGVFVGWFFFRIGRAGLSVKALSYLKPGHVFIVMMIAAFYGGLMIWNYRPLRYQLVLIYPIYAAAAVVLIRMWRQWLPAVTRKTPSLFLPVTFVLAMIAIYQIFRALAGNFGFSFFWSEDRLFVIVAALALTIIIWLVVLLYRRGLLPYVPQAVRPVVIGLLVLILVPHIRGYLTWANRPTYTAMDTSRDLATIVTPGAVVSGPFAPLLTLENRLGTIIHMFGVSSPDSAFFRRRPITHLLVDRMNERRAKADYPQVMNSALLVTEYHIGSKDVSLYRVAGLTGNTVADSLGWSLFEIAIKAKNQDSLAMADRDLSEFLDTFPQSFSGHLEMAELAQAAELYEDAEQHFKKAVELSPTNYVLVGRLARYYRDRYEQTGDIELRKKSLRLYKRAVHLAPDDEKLPYEYYLFKDQDE